MIQRINTFKLFHRLHKPHSLTPHVSPVITRDVATDKPSSKPVSKQENWTEIYRLPLIRIASAFNRLKVYQTFITALGTPIAFALENAGHLDPNYGAVFAALGVTGIATLTICSFPVQNLVGFVYMNDAQNKVKLAYVDFWGRRKDQELVIDDILAPWELPQKRIKIFQQIKCREGSSQTYKLLHRYGVVKDPQRYVTVFGEEN